MLTAYRFQAEHDDNNLIEMSYWVIDALAKYYADQGSSSVGQISLEPVGNNFRDLGNETGKCPQKAVGTIGP